MSINNLLPSTSYTPSASATQAVPFSKGTAPGAGPTTPVNSPGAIANPFGSAAGTAQPAAQNLASPSGSGQGDPGGLWGVISSGLGAIPSDVAAAFGQPVASSNPYTSVISQTGDLAAGIANAQNSQLSAQEQALGNQLLASGTAANAGASSGSGVAAQAAALANQIAALHVQQNNLDAGYTRQQLAQIPMLTALNKNDYASALANITAQQGAAKISAAQQRAQLLSDAAQRGAMTAQGTGLGLNQLSAALVKQLQQYSTQTTNASDTYHKNLLDLQKTQGGLQEALQKLALQNQIDTLTGKASGLSGSTPNPLAGLASFLKQQDISQQLSGLESQQVSPEQLQFQLLTGYGQISQLFGQDMATQWLLGQFAAYGIQIPGFTAPQYQPGSTVGVGGGGSKLT
jgi:hypothetical protein